MSAAAKKGPPPLALVVHAGAAPDKDEPDADDADGDGGMVDAADALLEAIKANDAKGVSEALSAHYDLCREKAADSDKG